MTTKESTRRGLGWTNVFVSFLHQFCLAPHVYVACGPSGRVVRVYPRASGTYAECSAYLRCLSALKPQSGDCRFPKHGHIIVHTARSQRRTGRKSGGRLARNRGHRVPYSAPEQVASITVTCSATRTRHFRDLQLAQRFQQGRPVNIDDGARAANIASVSLLMAGSSAVGGAATVSDVQVGLCRPPGGCLTHDIGRVSRILTRPHSRTSAWLRCRRKRKRSWICGPSCHFMIALGHTYVNGLSEPQCASLCWLLLTPDTLWTASAGPSPAHAVS